MWPPGTVLINTRTQVVQLCLVTFSDKNRANGIVIKSSAYPVLEGQTFTIRPDSWKPFTSFKDKMKTNL